MSSYNNNSSLFPVWDGSTPTRAIGQNKAPDAEDFDQLVAEVLAHQEALSGIVGEGPASALTESIDTATTSDDSDVIDNNRTRIAEIEAVLIAAGLLSSPEGT